MHVMRNYSRHPFPNPEYGGYWSRRSAAVVFFPRQGLAKKRRELRETASVGDSTFFQHGTKNVFEQLFSYV